MIAGEHFSSAQSRTFKWDISLGYGLAIPIGEFQKTAPAKNIKAVSSPTHATYYLIYGIAKRGNSYATNGQFISFDLNYRIGNHWIVALGIYHSRNPVDAQSFLTYANTVVSPDVTMVSNDHYSVTGWSTGFGYVFNQKKFRFSITPIIGQARISSPDYSFEWLTRPFYCDVIDLHKSLLWGLYANIGYDFGSRFYTLLKADFCSANFDFTVKMRSPGTTFIISDDRISYRLLKLGIAFGARF